MSSFNHKSYPFYIRIFFALLSLVFILLIFKVMTDLSTPSQFLNAYGAAVKKPSQVRDLQKLGIFYTKSFIYLSGPIIKASDENSRAPLFQIHSDPALLPSVFIDPTGAIEVLGIFMPLTEDSGQQYRYRQPLHFVGWRQGETAVQLFAIAESKTALTQLLSHKMGNWKSVLFARGLLLAGLVFLVFWFLNIAVLSTPNLKLIQTFIVNVVVIILFYSILILSNYPLLDTLGETLKIIGLLNLAIVPLAIILNLKNRHK